MSFNLIIATCSCSQKVQCTQHLSFYVICCQRLEERVGDLEDNALAQPKGPEPILTCVQCLAEYKESENGGILGSIITL